MRWSDAEWRQIDSSQFNAATDPRSANMKKPIGLIIHWTGTTLSAQKCWDWFNTKPAARNGGPRNSSAHFIIDRNGAAIQCVDTECRAFSVDGHVIDGSRVSVELVATPAFPDATDEQIVVCGDLLRWLNKNFGVPFQLARNKTDRGVSWHSLYSATACPGPRIKEQLPEIIESARSEMTIGPITIY